jgi:hypothetical protein
METGRGKPLEFCCYEKRSKTDHKEPEKVVNVAGVGFW